ncbi:MAG: hypothetical protein ABIX46_07370 [Burkholderiaceae bacterium]
MGTPNDTPDPERDDWLRAALRHAPDADVEAPPPLSAAILRAAQTAVAPSLAADVRPQRTAWRRTWVDAWAWLARPSVAAGFATLTVATLVGLLWRDRAIDPLPAEPLVALRSEAPTRAPALESAEPAAPPPTARSDALAQERNTDIGSRVHPPSRRPTAPPVAIARAPVPALDEARRRPATRPSSSVTADAPTAPAPSDPQATLAPPRLDRSVVAKATPLDATTRSADESARLAERSRRVQAPTPAAAPAAAGAGALGSASAEQPSSSLGVAEPGVGSDLRAVPGNRATAALPTSAAAVLRDLRERLIAQPQRWSWQLDTQAVRPVDPALLGWLAQAASAVGATEATRLLPGRGLSLVLRLDGSATHRLTLHETPPLLTLESLTPTPREPVRTVRLDPVAGAALADALARIGMPR